MSPQPLSTVCPNTGAYFSGAGRTALHLRPHLAPYVGEAIGAWSMVESAQLGLFIALLGGPTELAASIFLSLESSGPKMAAINAAAKTLRDDEQDLFHCINQQYKIFEKSRNKIAHWTWGIANKLEDAVLLADPRDSFRPLKPGEGGALFKRILVYTEDDLIDIIMSFGRLSKYLVMFKEMLRSNGEKRSSIFLELSKEPELQEKLSRRASRDPSNGG